jgi:hypothetical protein
MAMFSWLFKKNNQSAAHDEVQPSLDIRRINLEKYISHFPSDGNRCVYLHKKTNGEIFYVGIDLEDFRYSQNQPLYWNEYVEGELHGKFDVEILVKDVSSESAGAIKDRVLELFADDVINTVNFHRKFNMEIFEVYSSALKTYESLRAEGMAIEKSGNIELAIEAYLNAYDFYIKAMNSRNYDSSEQYLKAHSPPPPSQIVDRLSLCLLKKERYQDLIDFAERYSCYFMRKERTGSELKFFKRVLTAKDKLKG